MDGKHPNRKKDKYNPYELAVENEKYYVTFIDGQGFHHKEQISRELYELFDRFELEDISQLNVISRYQEHSELTEGTLNQRALIQPETMEEGVYRKIMYLRSSSGSASMLASKSRSRRSLRNIFSSGRNSWQARKQSSSPAQSPSPSSSSG